MDILLVMCAGVLLGARWFPQKLYRFNANLQLLCTVILIFSMGAVSYTHLDVYKRQPYHSPLQQPVHPFGGEGVFSHLVLHRLLLYRSIDRIFWR